MLNKEVNRRDFLKWSAVAGGTVAALSMAPKKVFSAGSTRISLDECLAMSPVEMAEKSYLIQDAWSHLKMMVKEIKDPGLRVALEGVLKNPAPTFMERYPDAASKAALRKELVQAGLLDSAITDAEFLPPISDPKKSPQPFYAAPGSGYQSHHSYPGGLLTHTDLNIRVSLALYGGYAGLYGYNLDRNVVIAAQVLHDMTKTWVFQWLDDASARGEMKLAGTGEHHCYSIAESMYRGFPPEVVVAQACAHNHPGSEKSEVSPVNWIKAAAIMAGIDPVKEGFLSKTGDTLPIYRDQEYFVTHLGDGDWVLTVAAAHWLIPEVAKIAKKDYGMTDEDLKGKKFNAFRNYLFSQASIMGLYQTLNTQGEEGLTKAIKDMVIV